MDRRNSSKLEQWQGYLSNLYRDFTQESKKYRCKIIGIENDQKNQEIVLLIMICGVKNQIIPYLPKELVLNDSMLGEFSPFDARAITFFALQKVNSLPATYRIVGQEFSNGKTNFVFIEVDQPGEIKKSARELYSNSKLLNQFNRNDLINIISSAIQEQTIEDLKK